MKRLLKISDFAMLSGISRRDRNREKSAILRKRKSSKQKRTAR